jgi:tetratricopeptide (TPR) repeat protein
VSQGKLLVVHDPERHELTVQLHQAGGLQSAPPVLFINPLSLDNRAELRWYLEDFLRFPVGIYPDRARRIEEKMAVWGGAMFDNLFGAGKARDFYILLKNEGLKNFDFEVHHRGAEARNFPWELLYDTAGGFYLVHRFASFLRHQEGAGTGLVKPHPTDQQLRVLLVIARPFGGRDVPYRTVARPIMELLQQPRLRAGIHVEVLRPPTFARFVQAVERTREDGGPFFDVVHFDGHGGFGVEPGSASPAVAIDVYKGPHGKLLFETEEGGKDEVEAVKLREVLGQHRVPLILLNACRSGMEALEDEKPESLSPAGDPESEEAQRWQQRLTAQSQSIASVAGTLLDAGAHGVVGMGYVVYAQAAAVFMRCLYERLLDGGTAAEAVNAGRLALVGDPKRPTRLGEMQLQDWLVPVYHQRTPVRLFTAAEQGKGPSKKSNREEDTLPYPPRFRFLGRDAELLHIERALRREGVAGVTLVGLGGTGKTALAVGCARWLADTHAAQVAGGVFFHAFADRDRYGQSVRPDLAALIRTVGRQLYGKRFLGDDEKDREKVTRFLQENSCLLLLDNAEAVCGLGEQPAFLSQSEQEDLRKFLREVCPPRGATRLLVTSRREEPWLGLNTEALEVGGLGDDAAEELALAVLRNSIGAADLEGKLADPAWQRDYDALLKELGGHPLALQIILPHLKDRPPGEISRSLNEGAKWLDGRLTDGASDRERTLAGCINYSFAALPQATRALLPVLAYFREWTDAEQLARFSALESVPAPARGVTAEGWTEVLVQAQATGLVRREGATSLFKLHPLLPWFLHLAVPEGESAALEAAVRSHLDALASALVEALRGREGAAAMKMFATSRASLLNGLELARRARDVGEVASLYYCLNRFMNLGGQHGQLEFLREALIKEWQPAPFFDPASVGGTFWLNLQLHRANSHLRQRKLGAAEETYREILAAAPGDDDVAERIFFCLGQVAQLRHDLARAEEWYGKALEVELRLGDEYNADKTYHELGIVALLQHDLARAEEWYGKSLEVKLRLGDEYGAAQTYHQLGMVAQHRHDLSRAEEWYAKALEVFLRLGDEHGAAQTYHQLGAVAQLRHDLTRAEEWYAKALEVFLRLGDEHGAAQTYHNLGVLTQYRHDLTRAEEWYAKALEVFLRLGDEHGASQTYHQLGKVAQDRHDLAGAEEWYGKSLEVTLRLGDEHGAANTYHQLGMVASQQGQPGCANRFLQAFKLYTACNDQDSAREELELLRQAYKAGIITHDAVELAWQTEMGQSLPTGVAEHIFGPDGQEGTSSTNDAPSA